MKMDDIDRALDELEQLEDRKEIPLKSELIESNESKLEKLKADIMRLYSLNNVKITNSETFDDVEVKSEIISNGHVEDTVEDTCRELVNYLISNILDDCNSDEVVDVDNTASQLEVEEKEVLTGLLNEQDSLKEDIIELNEVTVGESECLTNKIELVIDESNRIEIEQSNELNECDNGDVVDMLQVQKEEKQQDNVVIGEENVQEVIRTEQLNDEIKVSKCDLSEDDLIEIERLKDYILDKVESEHLFKLDNLVVDLTQIPSNSSIIDEILDNINLNRQNTASSEIDLQPPPIAISVETNIVVKSKKYLELKAQYDALTDSQRTLGYVAPEWVPDSECDECMKCGMRFTMIKRRHHCRACGLLFCSTCCNLRTTLPYNSKEQSRVCVTCFEAFQKLNELKKSMDKASSQTELKPIIPVLKKENRRKTNEVNNENNNNNDDDERLTSSQIVQKSVRFSDGIAPGCDLAEENTQNVCSGGADSAQSSITNDNVNNNNKQNKTVKPSKSNRSRVLTNSPKYALKQLKLAEQDLLSRIRTTISETNTLPPLIFKSNLNEIEFTEYDEKQMIEILKADSEPMIFYLLKNFIVKLKILNLTCCVNKLCWVFSTCGLSAIGQDELFYIIELNENEHDEKLPKQMFLHIIDIYEKACKGERVNNMNYLLYKFNKNEKEFLNNKENIGFLYYKPIEKFNCLENLEFLLPSTSFLIGILLQKSEIPWAKLFPLRLFLAFGAQYNTYPCTHVSVRDRKPIYNEIGHTIMNILCDLRNFQYTIPQINGLYITITENKTNILIPQSQYDLIMKSILTSNEYVFSLASLNFNESCEAHLVAIENENNTAYLSRKIHYLDYDKAQTGATFVVFNGSFKSTLTINAKQSIIEDGLMIQIDIDNLNKLKQALQAMKSYEIECKHESNQFSLSIDWYKGDFYLNKNIYSPIDSKTMCGIKSIRLINQFDYICNNKLLKWTELFLIKYNDSDDDNTANDINFNLNRFAEACSNAFYLSIQNLLDDLIIANKSRMNIGDLFKIGLRITILNDIVTYQIGACGKEITEQKYLCNLDNELIPILHQVNAYNINICVEFIFYVLDRFEIESIVDE